ncbi:hypothetical protein [Nonomuraea africana]|uniref:hypothetical protein n=1 Tax=Nonomuraea africana TaxID=46171 RepID=UPI0033C580EF
MLEVIILGDQEDSFRYITHSLLAHAPKVADRRLSAEQFSEFARDSFGDTERQLIDSFGHSKRALHAIVDDLLHAYGLLSRNRNLNFPKKLQLLNEAGILALSILKNLNVERNVMEHEYQTPSRQRTQEAIDVLDLLLPASIDRRKNIPYECIVGRRDITSHALLRLDPLDGTVALHPVTVEPEYLRTIETTEVLSFPVRSRKGKLLPHIAVDVEPAWKISLKYENRSQLTRWLSAISSLQRSLFTGRQVGIRNQENSMILYMPFRLDFGDKEPPRKLFDFIEMAQYGQYSELDKLPQLGGQENNATSCRICSVLDKSRCSARHSRCIERRYGNMANFSWNTGRA